MNLMKNASPSKFQKPFVIIPTYNEKDNIGQILEDVLRWSFAGLTTPGAPEALSRSFGFNVLVVDDHSPDGTGEFVARLMATEPRLHVIHRPGKLGLGTAYVDGFRYALAQGADVVFEMDADFSHDPKMLPKFLEALESCDMVVGSRYVHGISVVNWPLRRLAISLIASLYVRKVLQLPINDSTSGFVCYRRKVLEAIDLNRIRSNGYAFQIEMKFKAFHHGFRLKEIPIIFVDRFFGSSKISRQIVWEAIFIVWRLRWEAIRLRSWRAFWSKFRRSA